MVDKLFGERLKKIRMDKGLTQQDLAELLFVSRRCIGNWEASSRIPDITTIRKVADALEVDFDSFFRHGDDPAETPEVILVSNDVYYFNTQDRLLKRNIPKANVKTFINTELALEYARSKEIAVAFLELIEDAESVFSLAKELMSLNPRINVIYVSENSNHTMRALHTFCSGYMIKPFTRSKIIEQIKHLRFPVEGII